MTIVEFLTARLDDDDAYARNAAEEFGPDWIEIWSGTVDLSANLPERQPPAGSHWDAHVVTNDSGVSRHMVRHDPARVLREVAAKREIVDLYRAAEVALEVSGGTILAGATKLNLRSYGKVLRILAASYADHSDYDPAWNVNAT